MNRKTMKVYVHNIDEIKKLFIEDWNNSNAIDFSNGCQIINEKYSFLNENRFVDIILILQHSNYIDISITTAGASNSLLFMFNWGTEKSSINKKIKKLIDWCHSNNIAYEVE